MVISIGSVRSTEVVRFSEVRLYTTICTERGFRCHMHMCCVMSSSLLSVAEGALMSNLRLLLISSVQSPL